MKPNCPDEEILAAYVDDQAPEDIRAQVETHLSTCDACLEEFKLIRSMVRGGGGTDAWSVPPELAESAIRSITAQDFALKRSFGEKIGRLVNSVRSRLMDMLNPHGSTRMEPVLIRGGKEAVSEDLFRIKKSFKDFNTDIEIEKTGENTAHIRIWICEQNPSGNRIRITLKRGDRELCSSLLVGGRVIFEDISFGPCELIFERGGVSLGAYLFHIKETRHGKK